MPEIKNATVKKNVTRIAKVLNERGQNWSAEFSATVIVRSLLEECGEVELLNATDADSMKCRAELVAMITPLITAANNYQNTYINATLGDDGKTPLMAKVAGMAKTVSAEFA